MHTMGSVGDIDHGLADIQTTAKVGEFSVPWKQQSQVAHRLIRHAMEFLCNKILVGHVICSSIFAIIDQFPDLGQCFRAAIRIRIGIRTASPELSMIQLQVFFCRVAINHGAKKSIPDGKGLFPNFSRFIEPDLHGICIRLLSNAFPAHQQGSYDNKEKPFLHLWKIIFSSCRLRLNPDRPAEPAASVIRGCAIMIDKNSPVSKISKNRATQFSDLGWCFQPAGGFASSAN